MAIRLRLKNKGRLNGKMPKNDTQFLEQSKKSVQSIRGLNLSMLLNSDYPVRM